MVISPSRAIVRIFSAMTRSPILPVAEKHFLIPQSGIDTAWEVYYTFCANLRLFVQTGFLVQSPLRVGVREVASHVKAPGTLTLALSRRERGVA